MLNDPVLIDDEGGTIAEALFFIKNSVVFNHSSLEVAQQWKRYPDVLCKAAVGRNAIDADAENLCICSFEFGDISLIRLQFFRSTTGKGEHIEREYHVFRALEVVKVNLLAFSIGKREVGSGLAHLQMRPGRRGLWRAGWRGRGRGLLRKHRDAQASQQQNQRRESLNHFCRLLFARRDGLESEPHVILT